MCGICGVVQVAGRSRPVLDPTVLDWMTDVMSHRGPDDRGTYIADGVALGARRLSIVDVEGGHQPFANEDGTIWAVQNGELYNHLDLRRGLVADGHTFRGPAATRRSSRISTSGTATGIRSSCGACSASPSGTAPAGARS